MRLRAEAADPASVEANVLAVPIYKEDDPFADDLANLDAAAGGVIRQAIDWGRFNILEDYFALIDGGDLPVEHILIVNGVRRGRGPWRARRMAGVATRALQGKGATRLALWLRDGEDADGFEAAAVGAMAGTYRPMDLYGRTRDTAAMKRNVEEVVLLDGDQTAWIGPRPWPRGSRGVVTWPTGRPMTCIRRRWPKKPGRWRPTGARSRSSTSRRCASWA